MILRRLASSYSPSFKLPPTIRQLLDRPSSLDQSTITVSGWIKSVRRQKNVAFAVLTDGSSTRGLQAVFVGGGEGVNGLTNGAAVRLTGKLVPSPGIGQEKELLIDLSKGNANPSSGAGQTDGVHVLGKCDPEAYPIHKQALSTEYLRDHAHLRARTDAIAAMIRLRDRLVREIRSYFEDQGFCYAHTPVLTGNDAEGSGEAFKIAAVTAEHPAAVAPASPPSASCIHGTSVKPSTEFFSRPTYLTVSHQLHLEALATALSRVYTLSPCFRAEPSLTGRHLAEFWMLEAEWAFTGAAALVSGESRVDEVCKFVEGCLRGVVGDIAVGEGRAGEETSVLWKGGDEQKRKSVEDAFSAREPWTRISYTEAVKELVGHQDSATMFGKFRYEPKWGKPLQSEHERWLAETLVKGPVFIQDYPSTLKPFYMRQNDDGATVACFDLLVPYMGELVGGSVREERADALKDKMRAGLGADIGNYKWYLDLRRFGGAPHVGFGMGFERLVGWVGGIENVRECIPMPRWAGRMLL